MSGHVFISWSNTSNSACCFGDALRCVAFSCSKHGASQSALAPWEEQELIFEKQRTRNEEQRMRTKDQGPRNKDQRANDVICEFSHSIYRTLSCFAGTQEVQLYSLLDIRNLSVWDYFSKRFILCNPSCKPWKWELYLVETGVMFCSTEILKFYFVSKMAKIRLPKKL